MRLAVAVAELFDAVVGGDYGLVLLLDDAADVGGQVVFEGVLVVVLGAVLAAFALVENGIFVLAGERALEVDPAAVDRAGKAALGVRLAAEAANKPLQHAREFRTLL